MHTTTCFSRATAGLAAALLALSLSSCVAPTTANQEMQLLQALQSAATPAEKDAACVKLKRVATARAVPALRALLTDAQLSDSARYVLEAMSTPEAGQALLDALGPTSGPLKVGIVDSLGVRREPGAVPALATALRDADAVVAAAAATALGEIGNAEALAALESVDATAPDAVRRAAVDARLRCAHRLLAAGQRPQALAVFQQLHASASTEAVRMAAFRGRVLAAGADAVALTSETIAGRPGPEQTAALQLVHELDAPGATAAWAGLLPRLEPRLQVALIDGLSQRNDPAAAPDIAALASSTSPEVRLAVLEALGHLGDGTSVAFLVNAASTTTGAEQATAREALLTLRRGQPTEALLAQLPGAKPSAQGEIARALAGRRERSAIPKLLAAAQQGSASAAQAAVLALARLADFEPAAFAALVQIVAETRSDETRSAAVTGLIAACQHIRFRRGQADAAPLLQALARRQVEARVALLPVCAQLADPGVRAALRAALTDASPRVRDAATAALCDSFDAELIPDLVALARTAPNAGVRASAIAACVRLSSDDAAKLPEARRIGVLRDALSVASEPEQKRLVLSVLADIAAPESLRVVVPLLDDPAMRDAAAQAVVKIAPLLDEAAPGIAALQKAAAALDPGQTRQAVEQTLRQSRRGYGFITAWQASGPYRQEGRDYADLFDFVFRPETADEQRANWESRYNAGTAAGRVAGAQGVKWTPVPAPRGARAAWRIDLRKPIVTQECVAFAQTWLHCDSAQPVQLELGSDCLVKIWLNGKLIHTNPALRPLRPGADTLTTALQPGWNRLLLKLAQREQSATFCLRLLKPDGEPLDDLRVNSAGPAKN